MLQLTHLTTSTYNVESLTRMNTYKDETFKDESLGSYLTVIRYIVRATSIQYIRLIQLQTGKDLLLVLQLSMMYHSLMLSFL